MYKVKVNSKFEFDLNPNESPDWSLAEIRPGVYHILKDNRSFNAEVLDFQKEEKIISIKLNGKIYDIELKDKMDLLLEKLGMDAAVANKANDIKAPMPGLVLEIKVEIGQSIKKGDGVLILEAMKMENLLKAPSDGVIKAIEVKEGNAVEKNEVLVVLE